MLQMPALPLTYMINFDSETCNFSASSKMNPYIQGVGKSLFAAIDQLEANLTRESSIHDRLKVNLVLEEKMKDKVELTAKVSITV
jgi:hypothetical protein